MKFPRLRTSLLVPRLEQNELNCIALLCKFWAWSGASVQILSISKHQAEWIFRSKIGFDMTENKPQWICCMMKARDLWIGIVSVTRNIAAEQRDLFEVAMHQPAAPTFALRADHLQVFEMQWREPPPEDIKYGRQVWWAKEPWPKISCIFHWERHYNFSVPKTQVVTEKQGCNDKMDTLELRLFLQLYDSYHPRSASIRGCRRAGPERKASIAEAPTGVSCALICMVAAPAAKCAGSWCALLGQCQIADGFG